MAQSSDTFFSLSTFTTSILFLVSVAICCLVYYKPISIAFNSFAVIICIIPRSSGAEEPTSSSAELLYCKLCASTCKDSDALHTHYAAAHTDVYCADPCKRLFTAPHHLRTHRRRSSVHSGEKVDCLAGCGRTFASASAMWKHLERAGCPNAITALVRFIAELVGDVGNLIVNPGVQLSDIRTARWEVTSDMYDSSSGKWLCWMCNMAASEARHLQTHLDGGKHDPKVYKCPDPQCAHDASTLSNLVLHIECGKCEGYGVAQEYL